MPLTAVNFITKGPVLHADLLQFYNLFTGVMLDQPVTFKNVLTLGGNQGTSTVPLKVYGAVGQTSHLIDLYADTGQAQPGFGFGAAGNFGWGPGGASPQDTFLSRVATQNGHASDTAGLLVQPYLEVAGPIQATSHQFPNGTALTSTAPLQLTVNQDLVVNRDVLAGRNVIFGSTSLVAGVPSAHQMPGTVVPQPSLQIEAPAAGAYLVASGRANAGVAGNAFHDGTAWQRYDTTQPSSLLWATNGGAVLLYTAAAGTGVVGFSQLFQAGPGSIVTSYALLDATHLRANAYAPATTGAGFEAYYFNSSMVYVIGYNRTTNHYLDITLAGHNVILTPNEGGTLQLPNNSITSPMIAQGAIAVQRVGFYNTITGSVGAGWYETGVGGTATFAGTNSCFVSFTLNLMCNTVGAILQFGMFLDGAFNVDCGSINVYVANTYILLHGTFWVAIPAGSHRVAVGVNLNTGTMSFGRIGHFWCTEFFRNG